jgi:hypothetical protein
MVLPQKKIISLCFLPQMLISTWQIIGSLTEVFDNIPWPKYFDDVSQLLKGIFGGCSGYRV